jgi:hypothetical protein
LIAYLWLVFSHKLIYRQNLENAENEFFNRIGRLLTDLLLRTCHSARRTQAGRHPANLDPLVPIATGSYRAAPAVASELLK